MTDAAAALVAQFHPPSTKDFVWDCWGPSLNVGGLSFCLNFINFLVLLGFLLFIAFFFFGLRNPSVVPGRMQSLVELGIQFVRENIAMPMLGQDSGRFMPLLATFFFAIFFWNILEVAPGINFSSNSRIAFPLVMAVVAWVTYNAVGVMKHGFFGYLKHVMVPPGAPCCSTSCSADRIPHPDRDPADHPVGPTLGQLHGRALLARRVLPRHHRHAPGRNHGDLRPFLVRHRGRAGGLRDLRIRLQLFIFAILTASYIGGAMAEEH